VRGDILANVGEYSDCDRSYDRDQRPDGEELVQPLAAMPDGGTLSGGGGRREAGSGKRDFD